MTGSNLFVMKDSLNLAENLFVGEVFCLYGSGRAGGDADSTSLTERFVDPRDLFVFDIIDGIIGTEIVADHAAGAQILYNLCADTLDGYFSLGDSREGLGSSG